MVENRQKWRDTTEKQNIQWLLKRLCSTFIHSENEKRNIMLNKQSRSWKQKICAFIEATKRIKPKCVKPAAKKAPRHVFISGKVFGEWGLNSLREFMKHC